MFNNQSHPRLTATLAAIVVGLVLAVWTAVSPMLVAFLKENVEPLVANTSLWRNSGTFCQNQWQKVYDWYGGNAYLLGTLGSTNVYGLTFAVLNSLYLYMDITGRPAALVKYKIQPDVNAPPVEPAILRKVALQLPITALVTFVAICLAWPILMWRGCDYGRELPSFWNVLVDFPALMLGEEAGFYFSHRILHHPYLYKRIHKKHHELTAPISIAAPYAYPIENVFSGVLPPLLGPLVTGCHVSTIWLFGCYGLYITVTDHSGYDLPFNFRSPEFHDFHHSKFNSNFGVYGLLDRLLGTDTAYRQSKAAARHRTLNGITPLSNSVKKFKRDKKLK
ncbi:fatty acid hydroxylase domain-containing protein 2-like [Branchiostoma floridae]|uniref:Fatty acid hydroxylase domain-containing protein 2-like n=1 Tax=Branchiostoma floridae TaxID=7739 RepID=A0A9J7MX01_BRAFL|nr:fatty acid hydroxylase domain-containing protein 2-like [Branchiostoma floridae]